MSEPFLKQEEVVRYVLPRNETRHFGSLVIHPKNVHFAFQKKSEKVYILARKHFITNSGWITQTIFCLFLPFILIILGNYFYPELITSYVSQDNLSQSISPASIVALIFFYYALVITYAWTNYISWFFNVYLITNERMIYTNFKLLTGTVTTEAPLDRIVDISQETYGLLPSIFNYGNVKVQTATALKSKFNFHDIPDPSWFRSVLYELVKLLNGGEP